MKQRAAFICVFLFPLVIMLAWVGRLSFVTNTGRLIEIRTAPFDPRDLLAGKFMQFNLDYGPLNVCGSTDYNKVQSSHCVCLEEDISTHLAIASWEGSCEERPNTNCELWIKGTCEHSRFIAGIERFYLSEDLAGKLQRTPSNSTAKVRLDGAGMGVVVELLVEGVPIADYIRGLPEETK